MLENTYEFLKAPAFIGALENQSVFCIIQILMEVLHEIPYWN